MHTGEKRRTNKWRMQRKESQSKQNLSWRSLDGVRESPLSTFRTRIQIKAFPFLSLNFQLIFFYILVLMVGDEEREEPACKLAKAIFIIWVAVGFALNSSVDFGTIEFEHLRNEIVANISQKNKSTLSFVWLFFGFHNPFICVYIVLSASFELSRICV